MLALYDWIKLYGNILRSERQFNLLVKYSLLFALLWMMVFFAPALKTLPRFSTIHELTRDNIILGITIRDVTLLLIVLILGILHSSTERFQKDKKYFPITLGNYKTGLDLIVNQLKDKSDVASFLLLSMGRGTFAMFNWILNYFLIFVSSLVELVIQILSNTTYDSFLIAGRPENVDATVYFLKEKLEQSNEKIHYIAFAQKPQRTKSKISRSLLHIIKKVFGPYVFIATDNLRIIISPTGVTGTGEITHLRKFYGEVNVNISFYLLQCLHPDAVSVEKKINENQSVAVSEIESLYDNNTISIENVELLWKKMILVGQVPSPVIVAEDGSDDETNVEESKRDTHYVEENTGPAQLVQISQNIFKLQGKASTVTYTRLDNSTVSMQHQPGTCFIIVTQAGSIFSCPQCHNANSVSSPSCFSCKAVAVKDQPRI